MSFDKNFYSLNNIANVVGGSSFPKRFQGKSNGEFPFFKVSDMNSKENQKLMQKSNNYIDSKDFSDLKVKLHPKNTIIFPKVGGAILTNKKRILTTSAAFDNNIMGVIPTEKVLAEYLFHFFLSINLFDISNKAGLPSITQSRVESIKILLPSIQEQKQIVEILDQSFESIDKAKANIEKNIENAKELFQSKINQIFIQFDDSQGTKTIDELCHISRGYNPPKSTFIKEPKDGYVRFWQIRDGSSNDYKTYVPISDKLHLVEKSDMLMVAYRHIGRVFRGVKGAFNVALCKLSNKDKNVLLDDYLYRIIPTNFIKGELLKRSERSLIPSMSVNHLKELKIPVPSIEEQKEIVETLDILDNHIQSLLVSYEEELKNLEELKKSILQKAFVGELTNKSVTV